MQTSTIILQSFVNSSNLNWIRNKRKFEKRGKFTGNRSVFPTSIFTAVFELIAIKSGKCVTILEWSPLVSMNWKTLSFFILNISLWDSWYFFIKFFLLDVEFQCSIEIAFFLWARKERFLCLWNGEKNNHMMAEHSFSFPDEFCAAATRIDWSTELESYKFSGQRFIVSTSV